jgi:predicted acetyltransferase
VSNLRHNLNDNLYICGGHIGYGIRPDQRRKGYATKILKLTLIEAKKKGIENVLVTCNPENLGSVKAILNCKI